MRLRGVAVVPVPADGERRPLVLDVEALGFREPLAPIVGRARLEIGGERGGFDIREGDLLDLQATLGPPRPLRSPGAFDGEAWARREGLHALGYCKSPLLVKRMPGCGASRLRCLISPFREWARAALRRHVLAGPQQALVRAMVLGDRSGIRRGHGRGLPAGGHVPRPRAFGRAGGPRGGAARFARPACRAAAPAPGRAGLRCPRRLCAPRGLRRPGGAGGGDGHRDRVGTRARPGRRPRQPAGPGGPRAARLAPRQHRGCGLPALLRRHPGHRAPRSPALHGSRAMAPGRGGPHRRLHRGPGRASAHPRRGLPPPHADRPRAEPGRRAPVGCGAAVGGAGVAPGSGRGESRRRRGRSRVDGGGHAPADVQRRRPRGRDRPAGAGSGALGAPAVGLGPARAATADAGARVCRSRPSPSPASPSAPDRRPTDVSSWPSSTWDKAMPSCSGLPPGEPWS